MAGGQSIELAGYRFTAKPKSCWRRIIRDFWPYFQASVPSFVIMVRRVGSPAEAKKIKCYVRFTTGESTGKELAVPPLQQGETVDLLISGITLDFTGDTLLILPIDLVSRLPAASETLYAFHTTPKVWLTLTILTAIFAGVFASIGTWLFSLFGR